jgi:hypothetical protein
MVPSTDKLLDRVIKLLALAESPNVHEAAAAAGRAQALITRHKLEGLLEARERAEELLSDGQAEPLDVARKIRKWKVVLAAGLARANGCEAYTVTVGRREQHLCVAGRPADQAAVAALWGWLVKRLEWLSATHGAGEDREWHESFRIGAADTIVERLEAVQATERMALVDAVRAGGPAGRDDGRDDSVTDEGAPDEAALVRLDAALEARAEAVARYTEEQLKLKKGRQIMVRMDALEAGRLAGKDIALPND